MKLIAPYVAKALHKNTTLRLLGIPSWYQVKSQVKSIIGDDGIQALSEMLLKGE